jgi:hypothetical protein
MGRQMQVDIGEIWVVDAYNRSKKKLYCVAMVLSHSRYKYGLWYAKALKTTDFVQALNACFEYMGGMPKELVFDQDTLLAVSENYGDIIFTKEFEQYRLSSGFEVYLCRKNDPESKGRTEAVVKFFKGNYAKHRSYAGIDHWNSDFEDWLLRTGNRKKHGITAKIPAEVFEQERLFLKPVPSTVKVNTDILTRTVHKNNTIFYEGNRYTVPLSTYPKHSEVSLEIRGNKLIISDLFGDYIIAEHTLSENKGELIANNNHLRDNETKLNNIQQTLASRFEDSEEAAMFLTQIRRLKPRYARDQFALIDKTLNTHGLHAVIKALNYCITNSLYSAVELKNATEYYEAMAGTESKQQLQHPHDKTDHEQHQHRQHRHERNIIDINTQAAVSKKRALSVYDRIVKRGAH